MSLTIVNTQTAFRRQFLLVADSDAGNLAYTSKLLQKFQYKVWTAGNGVEALEMAETAMPALVIAGRLDDMAPVDFVRKLKRCASNAAVIVLNGKNDHSDERTCLAAGAVTCLRMPVQVENLYRVIQVAIEPVPRMNLRLNVKLPVMIKKQTVKCDDGGCARGLSEQGVFIRMAHPFPLKTRLPVEIHLADGLLCAEAEVIYTHLGGNQANQAPGMGMQFIRISPQDQERIRLFIRDEITRDIAIEAAADTPPASVNRHPRPNCPEASPAG